MRDWAMDSELTTRLRAFVRDNHIQVDPHFVEYQSGVYGLVDCVFSAQVRYVVVQRALERLSARLPDHPELTFQDFLDDVARLGTEAYAAKVLTRHRLGRRPGRLKVEVTLDTARFFLTRDFPTKASFQRLSSEEAKRLVLYDLVQEVQGIGPVLARYLLLLLGYEDHVKPDTLLTRLLSDVGRQPLRHGIRRTWRPSMRR